MSFGGVVMCLERGDLVGNVGLLILILVFV